MTEKQLEHNILMQYIEDDCYVDPTEKIDYPPVALSLGKKLIKTEEGQMYLPIPLGTYGNLSCVSAPPKTKKTFFISMLASVYLADSNIYGGNMQGHRDKGNLVHFDTEQGRWHSQRVFQRQHQMNSKIDVESYHTFGIADLVSDVNSLEESNAVVQKLMEWSANYNCHIINVIHQNYGTVKMTGHLGSFLEKKCETHIELEANTVNKSWVTVKCKRSRGYPFNTFSFEVNELGLPTMVNDLYDPLL
mgnify:CR=1 FL=1